MLDFDQLGKVAHVLLRIWTKASPPNDNSVFTSLKRDAGSPGRVEG